MAGFSVSLMSPTVREARTEAQGITAIRDRFVYLGSANVARWDYGLYPS
jgi:hypothetical protein